MSWLRGLLGRRDDVATVAPATSIAGAELPLGLRLGGAVALDPTPFDVAGAQFAFAPPRGHSTIEAYGQVDLGAGALLHRFYFADDAFLQVGTTAGVVDAIKYFVFEETRQPANQAAFKRMVESGSPIGGATIEAAGHRYRRIWSDAGDAWTPPVTFEEKVYRGRPPRFDYDLTHYCMLYQRDLPALDRTESLLVSAEDYGPDEFCVTYAIGIDVTTADLDIT